MCRPVILKLIFLISACLSLLSSALGQLPVCTSNTVYFKGNTQIYNYNPSQPASSVNPVLNTIAPPTQSLGLAVSANLNGAGPSPTFYTTVQVNGGLYYFYYDGSSWVNTGHTSGSVNHAAGGGYIFSIDVATGNVWRYDGTGNSIVVLTLPVSSGLFYDYSIDMAADCDGNFYILKVGNPQTLVKYNASGSLIASWPVTGGFIIGGGGMAIAENVLYLSTNTDVWKGVIGNGNINCAPIPGSAAWQAWEDFASCPSGLANSPQLIAKDTIYFCKGGGALPITAAGNGAFVWTVLSGPASITGSGNTVAVTSNAPSVIAVTMVSNQDCNALVKDTVTVIPVAAVVNAGPDHTVFGCGTYTDTLSGSLTGTNPDMTYHLSWLPAATISSGGTTLHPVIHPSATTVYTLSVTADSVNGCKWTDSVRVTVVDAREPSSTFAYSAAYGCTSDTVLLMANTATVFGPLSYNWDFDDHTPTSHAQAPAHVYDHQGSYTISLIASNGYCADTTAQQVTLVHPIAAAIHIESDTICSGDTIRFDASSSVPHFASLAWSFGDGASDTGMYVQHVYAHNGSYTVVLVLTDSLACSDTTSYMLSTKEPRVDLGPSDTLLCDGEQIQLRFTSDVSGVSLLWSDGSVGTTIPVTGAGVYFLQATNVCGTASDTIRVQTHHCALWLPDVFTPNGDGRNDGFGIGYYKSIIRKMDFRIYNRFGNLVFRSFNAEDKWDGNGAGIGSYYYYLWYQDVSGSEHQLKGDVLLLR